MKSFFFIFLVFILGCMPFHTTGNKKIADDSVVMKITPGVSNKADVSSLIGRPNYVHNIGEKEIWGYLYNESSVRKAGFIPFVGAFLQGVDSSMCAINITFNKNGLVESVGGAPSNDRNNYIKSDTKESQIISKNQNVNLVNQQGVIIKSNNKNNGVSIIDEKLLR